MIKNLLKNITGYAVSTLLILVAFEVVLSFLPVNSAIRTEALTADSSAFNVTAKRSTDFSFSTMWNFKNSQSRSTNNAGFFSDYDYEEGFNGYFIVGDSQVESVQLPFLETFHQKLAKKLSEDIYNIALSGAPLSQYHAYANEICNRYRPKKLLILLVSNDFGQSLKEHRTRNGWFHYDEHSALMPTPYEVTWVRKLANNSSLVQYLYFNLRAGDIYRKFFRGYSKSKIIEDEASLKSISLALDKRAIDIFFETFNPQCVNKKDILFITDANRDIVMFPETNVYASDGISSPSFEYFKKVASSKNFKTLDLHATFREDYKKNKKPFEDKYDWHWTNHAHNLAAQAILESLASGD